MRDSEVLICGSAKVVRLYCIHCKEYSLVSTRVKKCPTCKKRFAIKGDIKLRKLGEGVDKKTIPKWYRNFLIDKQNGKCYWCSRKFGFYYFKNGGIKKSHIHADHIIPYNYLQSNPEDNWAMSCSICNLFKSNKYYDNETQIGKYLKARWAIEQIELYYD